MVKLKHIIFFGFITVFSVDQACAMTAGGAQIAGNGDVKRAMQDEKGVKRASAPTVLTAAATTDAADNKKAYDGDAVFKALKEMVAARQGDETSIVSEIAQNIEQEGIDVNKLYSGESIFQKTLLHTAAKQGDRLLVRILLKAGDKRVNAEDVHKCTALYYAVAESHGHVAQDLLDAVPDGIDTRMGLSQKYKGNQTILHVAAAKGRHEVVKKVCVKYGAGIAQLVNHKDDYSRTALDYAIEHYGRNRNGPFLANSLLTIQALIHGGALWGTHEESTNIAMAIEACKNDDGTFDEKKVKELNLFS